MLSFGRRSSIPDAAVEFAGFVLAHCAAVADSNRAGELICPFAVLRKSGRQEVVDFESETQAEAVEKGWKSLPAAQSTKTQWAFGREGLFRGNDAAEDVLTVSTWLPAMKEHISVLQRFSRGPEQELVLHGEPELLIHGAEGATEVENWNRAALSRGIESHPQGKRWSEWRAQ
jgi:hypothetical protein